LAGYSFGCSLLAGVSAPECPLVLVAPTVGQHDYTTFAEVPNPMLVVAPDGDFAADRNRVTDWFATLTSPKQLIRGEWDAHFFRGFEEQLAETVFEFLQKQWEDTSCR
jgi:alpha/beta superfamily hydrolase